MSSFDNEGFFNSGVICDSLSVSGKTPDFRDGLIILVIWVSSTSTHDFNGLVGSGSNAHVLIGDVRINFLTSSEVAGSKHLRTFYFRRWNKFGFTVISAELQSIFFNLVNKER